MADRRGNQKPRLTSAFIGLLMAAALVLAACGGGSKPQSEQAAPAPAAGTQGGTGTSGAQPESGPTGEVKLWTEFTSGGEGEGINQLISAWHARNAGITVTHRPIGNEEFFTVVRTGLAGGDPPDLLQYEGYQQTRDFARAGHLMDLTDWWAEHKDQFVLAEAGEKACTYEGKIYCMPYTTHTGWQIYYNPEILAKYQIAVPATFEDFLAAAEKLKQNGVTPIALGNKHGWPGEHWYMAFLVQRCGVDEVYRAINRQGARFTDSCFVQAAGDLQNLARSGYLSPGATSDDYGAAQAYFLSGKAAFFQTGNWYAAGWQNNPPPFQVGIMSFPRFKDTPFAEDIMGAVTHVFAIPAHARNKEAALEVLTWMASAEAGKIWASNGMLSLVRGAVESSAPEVIKDLWGQVLVAKKSLPWIENELPPGVGEDKIYNGTIALINGTMTPEQFSQSVQDALEASK